MLSCNISNCDGCFPTFIRSLPAMIFLRAASFGFNELSPIGFLFSVRTRRPAEVTMSVDEAGESQPGKVQDEDTVVTVFVRLDDPELFANNKRRVSPPKANFCSSSPNKSHAKSSTPTLSSTPLLLLPLLPVLLFLLLLFSWLVLPLGSDS